MAILIVLLWRISIDKFLKNSKLWILSLFKIGGISEVRKTDKTGIFEVWFPEFCFPEAWLKSSVPVIFDFRGDGTTNDLENMRNTLYCLFPQVGRHARVAELSRKAFIDAVIKGEWTQRVQDFINKFRKQDESERQKQQQAMLPTLRFSPSGSPLDRFVYKSRRRRF